jgi:hypothetical protein
MTKEFTAFGISVLFFESKEEAQSTCVTMCNTFGHPFGVTEVPNYGWLIYNQHRRLFDDHGILPWGICQEIWKLVPVVPVVLDSEFIE